MKNVITAILLLIGSGVSAQVKLDLEYSQATQVYTVSIVSEVDWVAPKNMLNSAQIVLRVASDQPFTPAITSLVNGLVWADNAYIEQPAGAPGYTFVCISLVNGPTTAIGLQNGVKVPLFSFKNASGGCVGKIGLLPNTDPMVQAVRAGGINVTQYFGMLGARGNAIDGVLQTEVNCGEATGTQVPGLTEIRDIEVSPVPADRQVRISWTQEALRAGMQLVVFDGRGKEVYRTTTATNAGAQQQQIDVTHWPGGLYRIRFISSDQRSMAVAKNLMVIH
jgi:hypothetical protein